MIDLALAFFRGQFFTRRFVFICFMMKKNNILNLLLSLGVSFSTASLSKAELVEGLIEYWEFDGDFSAGLDEANDGILEQSGIGKASFVAGKFGSAVDLENSGGAGNQAVINVGAPGEFAFEAGSMSVSVWYTTESLYTGWNTLISQGEGNNWRIARHGSSGTNLKYSVGGPGNVPANLDQQDESWHHVAVTHDAVGNITMYIDGEEAASQGAWELANGAGLSFVSFLISCDLDPVTGHPSGRIPTILPFTFE